MNLGDALERSTGGLLRATPHRVQPRRGATRPRLSLPFFFDPSFDAPMRSCEALMTPALRASAEARRAAAPQRWDGRSMEDLSGTYGAYLLAKVAKVFPELAGATRVGEGAS